MKVLSTFLPVTSEQAFYRLMFGDAAETLSIEESDEVGSYLMGITGDDEDRDFAEDLNQSLPWLGEHLAQPLDALLHEEGCPAVTLVLSGPLGLAPLHAAPWDTDEGSRCLLDGFDVRFAPSASVQARSITRASETPLMPEVLLALANPTHDLAAAVPEAEEIIAKFPDAQSRYFEGDDATSAALAEHAADATHIHLACHAQADMFHPSQSEVVLADRAVSALEFTGMVGLNTRLVAISACQTGMAEITEMADEAMSFGTSVLAAGSACAIATLWPVNDAATALLMTRTYEELATGVDPPQALRKAQLWLRDLDEDAEQAFLAEHPALQAEFQRRTAAGDIPGRRGNGLDHQNHPFSHPSYWAPFIASGA